MWAAVGIKVFIYQLLFWGETVDTHRQKERALHPRRRSMAKALPYLNSIIVIIQFLSNTTQNMVSSLIFSLLPFSPELSLRQVSLPEPFLR